MTKGEMGEKMQEVFDELHALREAGQKEYAHEGGDAFANFNRVASHLGLDRQAVLMVYLLKHIDGISAYVQGHKSQREDVRGRINDSIVYLTLLRGMIDEGENKPLEERPRERKLTAHWEYK